MKKIRTGGNNSMQTLRRLLLPGLVSLFFIVSCTANAGNNNILAQPAVHKQPTAQIIIKFRNESFDPSQAAFIQELSRNAKATLVYLRPMSGGAHVFRAENIVLPDELTEIILRLSKRPDVLYVEQDSIMQHQ
jgi:hypothetical protein